MSNDVLTRLWRTGQPPLTSSQMPTVSVACSSANIVYAGTDFLYVHLHSITESNDLTGKWNGVISIPINKYERVVQLSCWHYNIKTLSSFPQCVFAAKVCDNAWLFYVKGTLLLWTMIMIKLVICHLLAHVKYSHVSYYVVYCCSDHTQH